MTYDFFASKADKIEVLDFIFSSTSLQIYDLGSAHDQEIVQYKSTGEIVEKFDLENGNKFAVTFNCWSPTMGYPNDQLHIGQKYFRQFGKRGEIILLNGLAAVPRFC